MRFQEHNSKCGLEGGGIQSYAKVQSCKVYNKYMIASSQITNTEIFAFIVASENSKFHG